ncbi:hypothetical protein HNR26_000537 [Rhizobium rosettiformans]|uniref:Uncharacterized protein n=1 Tax=Rhizobium rosettiformans TaxID=1368430 RepID=A0A7W8MBT3_9HYPH|nr:hypothetical protein [Rhizobium rosettiformans]MBB5274499.1 hypothetical protein [Rhizobium rosettiformans]
MYEQTSDRFPQDPFDIHQSLAHLAGVTLNREILASFFEIVVVFDARKHGAPPE